MPEYSFHRTLRSAVSAPDYIPQVSHEDVLRIVDRDYTGYNRQAVLDILAGYGTELDLKPPNRVHLAILKLAEGDLDGLRHCVHMAQADYRDVLAYAEYPKAMSVGPGLNISPEEQRQIQEDDWQQYREWLLRDSGYR